MRFNGIYISNSKEKSSDHSHEFWELCMNLEGKTINVCDGVETVVDPGTIFLCPPGCIHSKRAISGTFKDIFIGFEDNDFFGKVSDMYYIDHNNTFYNLFMIMYDTFHGDSIEKIIILNNLLETICCIIKSRKIHGTQSAPIVDKLKETICNNFSNPEFKISDFTENNKYNNDYLRQAFKKQLGVSPLEYLNELRINNAKKMLLINREPAYRISEIAQFSGFYDVGYFTRIFKKKTGMTPSDYRLFNVSMKVNTDDFSCC